MKTRFIDLKQNKRYLRWLILYALKKDWCVDYSCTTCGANQYRRELMNLSRTELIEQLKHLPKRFLQTRSHREPLLFAIYAAVELVNFKGLLKEFEAAPIAGFLKDAIEIEANRKEQTKLRIQKEQNDKKEKDRIKAQENIWGAIKRNDFLAIKALMLKGINLEQVDTNGVLLKDRLKELGVS